MDTITTATTDRHLRLLREHARTCRACLADLTLAVVSLRICGEVRVPIPYLCHEGEQLLARLSAAMRFPYLPDGSVGQAPRSAGPSGREAKL